jgi:hypothetical protein
VTPESFGPESFDLRWWDRYTLHSEEGGGDGATVEKFGVLGVTCPFALACGMVFGFEQSLVEDLGGPGSEKERVVDTEPSGGGFSSS